MPGGRIVASKTSSSKGKKTKESAPRKTTRAKAPAPVEADRPDADEDEDEDEKPAPAPKKAPAAAKGRAAGEEAPQVVPARRLTPEAKARVNEMVQKGVPLQDALRAAASWETFVAPVREEPAKLVGGRSFEGAPHPKPARKEPDDEEEEELEPAGSSDDD
jgi:hypothetical protein